MESDDKPPDKGGGEHSRISLDDIGMREVVFLLYGDAAREQDETLLDAVVEEIGSFGNLPSSCLQDETKRLELKAEIDLVIDRVKATLELQTLAIPLGEEPAAGNQREVTEVVKKILDMNFDSTTQEQEDKAIFSFHARFPRLEAVKLKSSTISDLEWRAFSSQVLRVAAEAGLTLATASTAYSQAMVTDENAPVPNQTLGGFQTPHEASGGHVAGVETTTDQMLTDEHKGGPSSLGEEDLASFPNTVDSLAVQLEVGHLTKPSDAWVLKREQDGTALLHVPADTLESQLFSQTVRQRIAGPGEGSQRVAQWRITAAQRGNTEIDEKSTEQLTSERLCVWLELVGQLDLSSEGRLEEAGEDEEDSRIWRQSHWDKAVACDVEIPSDLVWGFVLSVSNGEVRVLFGDDMTVRLPKPSVGHWCRVSPGEVTVLVKSTTRYSGGVEETTYTFAKGKEKPSSDVDIPRMRGVVHSYEWRNVDGKPERKLFGKLQVPSTGTQAFFEVTSDSNQTNLPVGSIVLFYPAVKPDDGDSYSPTILGIDEAERISIPRGSESGSRPPVSQSELVEGFYAPSVDLQNYLNSQLGVDSQPYVGEELSALAYCGGEQLIRRLTSNVGSDAKVLDLSLLQVQKCMVVGALLKEGSNKSQSDLKLALREKRTHLVLPAEGNVKNYANYLKDQFTAAREAGKGLHVVVGVPIYKAATPEGLYNTEDCPFFSRDFPWVASYHILEGSFVINEFNPMLGEVVPAAQVMQHKKLLLVVLDSTFQAKGAFPVPRVLKPAQLDGKYAPIPPIPDNEVLVGLDQHDPMAGVLQRESGASLWRIVDGVRILILPFSTGQAARNFVKNRLDKGSPYFCMLRKHFYAAHTYTLVVREEVKPSELYTFLQAVEVMPAGSKRYRFTSVHNLLTVARILYSQNRYVKKIENKRTVYVNKFRTLRDDHDYFVFVDNKRPTSLSKYMRLPPSVGRQVEEKAPPARERRYWFNVTNLPVGVAELDLKQKLQQWNGLRGVLDWKIDRAVAGSVLWLSVADRQRVDPVIPLAEGPAIILPTPGPPPAGVAELGQIEERVAPDKRLASITDREEFVIAKNTQRLLHQIAAREAKDVDGLLGIVPGSDEPITILKRGETLPSARRAPLGGSSKSSKRTKATGSNQRSGGPKSRSAKALPNAPGKAGKSASRTPSGRSGGGESAGQQHVLWADLGETSSSTSPEGPNANGATISPGASSANEQRRRAGLPVSSTGTSNLNNKSGVLQEVLNERKADMDLREDKSTVKRKRGKMEGPQEEVSTKKHSVALPPDLKEKRKDPKPKQWRQQLLTAYSDAFDQIVNNQ